MSGEPGPAQATTVFTPCNDLPLPEAAVRYAEMGLSVFPLQSHSKLPLPGWSWKRMATSNPAMVRSWWQQWPTANIGLALGEPSGADALDVDVKGGQEGWRSYQAIVQDRYWGPVQATPSGGHHLLFTHTPGLINFTHRGELGGLDMRTTGGYIVAAPSRTPEGPYQWVQDGQVPPMPPALLQACQRWSTQSNTQVAELPDIPEDLPNVGTLGLKRQYLAYLQQGDTSHWNNDESRAVFATAGALMRRLQDPGMVFGLLAANDYAWTCAERHREFGDPAQWLWKYGVAKIITEVGAQKPLEPSQVFSPLPVPAAQEGSAERAQEAFWTPGSHSVARANLAPRWLVKGLLERGQVGVLYGDSQALKSYLMLDLAVHIATGRNWHGHRVAEPARVWYLAGEGNAILWRRLEALRQALTLPSAELENLWLSSRGLNLMDPTHVQFLMDSAASGPPAFLVVDTLTANAFLEENSAAEASQLLATCQHLAHLWDCTHGLVHHAGKGDKRTMRGSSVLTTNADFVLMAEREPNSQRPITQVWTQKLKGAPEPHTPLVFEGVVSHIAGVFDDEGSPVTDLVLRRLEGAAATGVTQSIKERSRLTQQQAEMLGALREIITSHWTFGGPNPGVTREELREAYRRVNPGVTDTAFSASLDRFINRSLLNTTHEGDTQIIELPKDRADLTPGGD